MQQNDTKQNLTVADVVDQLKAVVIAKISLGLWKPSSHECFPSTITFKSGHLHFIVAEFLLL